MLYHELRDIVHAFFDHQPAVSHFCVLADLLPAVNVHHYQQYNHENQGKRRKGVQYSHFPQFGLALSTTMFSLPFSIMCSIALRYLIWKALLVSMISAISLISFPTSTSAWKSISMDSFVLLCIATCSIDRASSSLISRSILACIVTLYANHLHIYPPMLQLMIRLSLQLLCQFGGVFHNNLKQILAKKSSHSCSCHGNDAVLCTAAQFVCKFDPVGYSVKDHHFQLHLNIVLAAYHLAELKRLCLQTHSDN